MIFRKQSIVETITALVQNPALLFLVGILTLTAGLAIVLAHNAWAAYRRWWSQLSAG